MSIVNEDDFKSMWVKRFGHEPVYYSEKYKNRRGFNDLVDDEDKDLINRVEIGGITFKVGD